MNEPYPPSAPYPPQPPAKPQGIGCFAKGCLVTIICLMLLGVLVGGFGWAMWRSITTDYMTHDPVAIRTFPATDEQYNAVMAKLQPFVEPKTDSRPPKLELTSEDLNVLIARHPQFADARSKVYITITGGQIITDVSTPLSNDPKLMSKSDKGVPRYVSGRVKIDASFANGEFALVLRGVEPLNGKGGGLVSQFVNKPDFRDGFSQKFTESLNEHLIRRSNARDSFAAMLKKMHTVIVEGDKIVATPLD